MDITALYSSTQTRFAPEIDEDNKRRDSRSASPGSLGDTVTFSDEGRELASKLAARLAAELADELEAELAVREEIETKRRISSSGRKPAGEAPASDVASDVAGSAAGSAGADNASSSAGIDGQIEKLQAQIRQVAQQVNSILSGSGTPEEKSVQSAPLQQKIGVLQEQVQELLAQKREDEMKAKQSA